MLNAQNSLMPLQPEIQARDSMADAGKVVLNFHYQLMLQNETGTRLGENVEALHDMRVAIRRMRAAFRIFIPYYADEVIKPYREGLKVTGRILGTVRDWDVLFEKTQVYVDSLAPPEQSSLKFLMDSWSHEREQAREQLLVYLDGQSYRDFKTAFQEFINLRGDNSSNIAQIGLVYQDAPSLILSRYEWVLAHEENLQNPTVQQLHALRIDFKRLRYTIEFFRSALGEATNFCIEELKILQDYLGDLNDARVANLRIQKFINSQVQDSISKSAVDKFYEAKQIDLSQMVAAFPQFWSRFRQPEFRQNLDNALEILQSSL